jgi:importin-9
MVKGDLIIVHSNRIKTRSQAKQSMPFHPNLHQSPNSLNDLDPDQYTIIPATLKILKVLVEELLSASGTTGATSAAAAAISSAGIDFGGDAADDGDDDDDGWEDEPDNTIDLSLGTTKADLLSYLEAPGSGVRQRDDETQAYLTDFFVRAARENIAGFEGWYNELSEDEKGKLQELAAHQ